MLPAGTVASGEVRGGAPGSREWAVLDPRRTVDRINAVVLTGVTGMLHWSLGNVQWGLVGALLIGSIPGGLLGSHLSTRMPMLWLRRILCVLLLATGARMLWPAL